MRIESIKLQNFRCFENLELKFHEQLTVIVGKNASGKSTILDAVAISVGTFPSSFDGIGNYSQSIVLTGAGGNCKSRFTGGLYGQTAWI